jgi:opacity protein-like surface antigen
MIGPSFATLGTPFFDEAIGTDTIVTGGIALGIAVERSRGRLRAEVEGMARGDFDAPFIDFPTDRTVVTNNWSVMTNLWRDVMITDQVGIYVGGGIGAGGYRMGELCCGELEYLDPKAAFAWQAGGGLLWEISDRLTFDMGYRFYQMDVIEQDPFALPNRFASSELMFTLRLYEPFRRWR